AVYDALVEKRGVVPNMIKTVANSPELVKGFAAFMGPLMGPGEVSQQLKELIALYVSLKNNCHY
ncbi:MAG: carboxymuconolactone decarboxylase family protein, partial [Acidobacteria bacterium]|nr:carboxymuconolactone decarboxylase family protein [Acidobacteriota bacterium]